MLNEFYYETSSLISKGLWERKVDSIKSSIMQNSLLGGEDCAASRVEEELIRAVKERIPDAKFGVLFSGGVDSSLIALILKKAGRDFACYTLGFKNEDTKDPEDVEAAKRAASLLGLKLKKIILDVKEAEGLISRTVKMLGPHLNNVVNVGVASVELGCIEMARKDGVRFLFIGLGSEEIFAGYDRHKRAKDVQEECWRGLNAMYERDLLRDYAIASGTGMSFITPFLDEKLIEEAMRLPAEQKINGLHSKLVLREAAERIGLHKEIAWRPKRAAQYGSRMDKAIDKLARMQRFRLKKDYLKSLE